MDNPQLKFRQTTFDQHGSAFWYSKRETVRQHTLPYQLDVLKSTGRFDAFKLGWNDSYTDTPDVWPVPNHLFWDSDVAKWIEGACYFLDQSGGDKAELRRAVQELVQMIESAQQPDGYLNIHFTVVEPEKRFSNLRDLHELYNAGHLIEAALAHKSLTKTDGLLRPLVRYANLLSNEFGPAPQQRHAYPGHPEIELALIRLYRETSKAEYLDLARYFIEERGNPTGEDGRHYYDVEAEKRGDRIAERPAYYPKARSYWYQQAHIPVSAQETIEGHAVRAMYLLTAVADLVHLSESGDPNVSGSTQPLKNALFRLWDNMVERKMYLTGGIGAIEQWEGFGADYFLPQGSDEGGCYAETCAAIGVIMLAERLLQIDLDGRFGDVMELCLYNAMLTGMSHDGKAFTYVNQLASSDGHPSKREDWFRCACCPPNVTRLLGSLGGYLWSHPPEESAGIAVNIHQYASATLTAETSRGVLSVKQTTEWPWAGKVRLSVHAPPGIEVTLRLRIPAWAPSHSLSPALEGAAVRKGYLELPPSYTSRHPDFELDVPMAPRLVSPHPYTNQRVVALARGPLVFCVEDTDNPWVQDHFKSVVVRAGDARAVTEERVTDGQTGEEYVALAWHGAAARRASPRGAPAIAVGVAEAEELIPVLHFVPYYFRANRGGRGQMRVGLTRA